MDTIRLASENRVQVPARPLLTFAGSQDGLHLDGEVWTEVGVRIAAAARAASRRDRSWCGTGGVCDSAPAEGA